MRQSVSLRKEHTINAEGRVLGRLASQAAFLLRGKHKVEFVPNKDEGDFVVVYNTDKMKFTGKRDQKTYWRHTGYIGHVKLVSFKTLFEKDSREVFRRAVFGMLPINKLRSRMIKRLKLYKKSIEDRK